ncbi:hypothetical protein OFB58_25625, partial [Escherichia coli]|nr:hypothetical protein [Escherichia coli]
MVVNVRLVPINFDKHFKQLGEVLAGYRGARMSLDARKYIKRFRILRKPLSIREIAIIIGESR